MKQLKSTKYPQLALLLAGIIGLLSFTETATALTLQTISNNVESAMAHVAEIMQSVALISGIAFIMASLFKFNQHKTNPQQVHLSQGLTLLLIGAALCLFPTLIPTATSIFTGTTSTDSVAKLNGTGLSNLIGANVNN